MAWRSLPIARSLAVLPRRTRSLPASVPPRARARRRSRCAIWCNRGSSSFRAPAGSNACRRILRSLTLRCRTLRWRRLAPLPTGTGALSTTLIPDRRSGIDVGLIGDTALVLFSGGQDSTVCLAWALERFDRVETIGFDYAQRHKVELDARLRVRARITTLRPAWAARLGDDHAVRLDALSALCDTALTREIAIEIAESGLPTTFVPGRNLVFFAFAGALAYRRGAKHLVAGMCETDYSGYPDCRDDTLKAMQVTLGLGMDRRFVIHTPLMWIGKAQTFGLAFTIGGDALVDLLVEETHTCYLGDRSQRHPWGFGCGECPACKLRAEGFARWMASR